MTYRTMDGIGSPWDFVAEAGTNATVSFGAFPWNVTSQDTRDLQTNLNAVLNNQNCPAVAVDGQLGSKTCSALNHAGLKLPDTCFKNNYNKSAYVCDQPPKSSWYEEPPKVEPKPQVQPQQPKVEPKPQVQPKVEPQVQAKKLEEVKGAAKKADNTMLYVAVGAGVLLVVGGFAWSRSKAVKKAGAR
jgi:hypothetical protein